MTSQYLEDTDPINSLRRKSWRVIIGLSVILFAIVAYQLVSSSGHGLGEALIAVGSHATISAIMMLLGLLYFNDYEREERRAEAVAFAANVAKHLQESALREILEKSEKHDNLIKNLVFGPDNPLTIHNYAGLTRVHKHLSRQAITEIAANGCDINILNVWLPEWEWLEPILIRSIHTGHTVRLLLLDQDDEYAETRGQTLERDVPELIRDSYRRIRKLYKRICIADPSKKINLHLRLYRGAPPCSLYGIGDHSFMGLYGVNNLAIDGVQFEFPRGSVLGSAVWLEFDSLWGYFGDKSADVDLSTEIVDY